MIVIFFLICASLIAISNFSRMPWLNPISALVFPWFSVMLLASLPGVLSPGLSTGLWIMVLTGFLATAIGSLCGWIITAKRSPKDLRQRPIKMRRVSTAHNVLTVVLALYGFVQAIDAWPVLQSLGGVEAIFSTSAELGNEYKFQYSQTRVEVAGTSIDGSGFLTGAVGYVLFLGHISLFTGALLWKSGLRLRASIPLVLAGAYSLFSLQRTSFFMCFLIFLVTSIYARRIHIDHSPTRRGASSPKKRGKLAGILVGGAIVIPVLLYPIQQRNSGSHNSTGFESLAQYLLSSIAGLNQRISSNLTILTPPAEISGEVAPSQGLGAYTFTGLFTLLKRLGLQVPVAPHSLDYYSTDIFGTRFATNTGTSYLDFYLDFGWAGVAVMSFGMGFLASLSLRHYLAGHIRALPVLVMLVVSIIWSFFVNALMGDFRYLYMTLIASALLPWLFFGGRQANDQMNAVTPTYQHEKNPS